MLLLRRTRVERLKTYARGRLSENVIVELQNQASKSDDAQIISDNQHPLLFEEFQKLQKTLSYFNITTPAGVYKVLSIPTASSSIDVMDIVIFQRFLEFPRCSKRFEMNRADMLLKER